ncbi:hypothetical protein WS62_05535 [Burkholderia sp. ABCPW 14]|nr:hypothetical protein WS62_05535 [Burkholderia sp. ABCPW 14]
MRRENARRPHRRAPRRCARTTDGYVPIVDARLTRCRREITPDGRIAILARPPQAGAVQARAACSARARASLKASIEADR